MGKLIVVENDKVEGTDKHNVSGEKGGINPSPPPPSIPYAGIGDFDYVGKITDQLSDFVSIIGKPVALKNSKSSLNPGESAAPAGKHSCPNGKNYTPTSPQPIPTELQITDAIGEGTPSATAGSSFVTINGLAVLLDGDKIDTCDGTAKTMNSSVTAENQEFVSCAE